MAEHGFVRAARRDRFSVAEAADALGLSCARVRHYAETYRDFLGMKRDADGQWEFSAAHLRFLEVLAAGGTAAEAIDAWRGKERPSVVTDAASEQVQCAPDRDTADETAADEAPIPQPQLRPPTVIDRSAADALFERVDDLALHVEDLAEETKQIQMLLSRVIALLDEGGRRRSGEVHMWEPKELTPAPGIVHALIPPQPQHPHYPSAAD